MESIAKVSRVTINNILLATDFSSESQNALACATSLAKRFDAKLVIAHAVQPDISLSVMEPQVLVHDTTQSSADKHMALIERRTEVTAVPHEAVVKFGEPWQVVSEVVSDKNIDLIVMGTRGRGGFSKLFLGSTAEKAMRHACCPVLTVGPEAEGSLEHIGSILYATDFSDGSARALPYALELAEQDGAELTMLHVIEATPEYEGELVQWRAEDLKKLREMTPAHCDLPRNPEIEIEVGSPAEEIVRLANARHANLIVMGAHAHAPVATHVPWTTLHHVLQHARCPVLTVRAQVAD